MSIDMSSAYCSYVFAYSRSAFVVCNAIPKFFRIFFLLGPCDVFIDPSVSGSCFANKRCFSLIDTTSTKEDGIFRAALAEKAMLHHMQGSSFPCRSRVDLGA